MSDRKKEKPTQTSFLGTLGAVAWSFIGLRRNKDFAKDVTDLNPVYVVVAGLIGVAIFISILLFIVKSVLS